MSDQNLLSLGMFVFGMQSLPFAELQRMKDWRHGKTERHGARPASQYLGPGEDSISITGILVPEVAGAYSSLARLAEMADTGDAWPLVDGAGTILGNFRIIKVDERQSNHINGGFARKIDFAVDLERADDSAGTAADDEFQVPSEPLFDGASWA